MSSLRGRLVWLCMLVAMLSTGLGLLAAFQASRQALAAREERAAIQAQGAIEDNLRRAQRDLAATLGDYAQWDEMYANMPDPEPGWAMVNMAPTSGAGQLLSALVADHGEGRFTRYRAGRVNGTEPSEGDPASASAIARLISALPGETQGVARLDGRPALYAIARVRRSAGDGPPHGRLLALAYLDAERLERLTVPGWTMAVDPTTEHGTDSDHRHLNLASADGPLRLALDRVVDAGADDGRSVLLALLAGGVASALLAVVIGIVLGWFWLDGIRLVARVAAARARDSAVRLPDPANLPLEEARELATSLAALDAAAEIGRRDLALALDRAEVANRVHRRFLSQLGHEFGQPLRRIIAATAQMQDGSLDPAEAAAVRHTALDLEARLQEVLGLVEPTSQATALPGDLLAFAQDAVSLVTPRAAALGTRLHLEVPSRAVQLDAALLTPVLVNLLVNGIAAAPGGTVQLRAQPDGRGLSWLVHDDGCGLTPDQARGIGDALRESGIAAGDERIGLGLALCLANVRAMGGRLELAASAPGQGTTMVVWIPWPEHGPGAGSGMRASVGRA